MRRGHGETVPVVGANQTLTSSLRPSDTVFRRRPLARGMRTTRLLAATLLIVASCTGNAADPSAGIVSSTTLATTTTTAPEPEAFNLFAGQGYTLDVFRQGLIETEREVTAAMFPGLPLYEADLTLSPEMTGLEGSYSVRYTNTEEVPLQEVVFRLFPNISDGATVIVNLTVDDAAAEPSFSLQRSVMSVPLAEALAPGESVLIEMGLEVTVPIEEGGKYGTFLLDEGILSLAHALPLLAVYDDEGWNLEIPPPNGDSVYSDAAFFLVRVAVAAGTTLATSGRQISVEQLDDGIEARLYAAGPVRDFYMAASDRLEMIVAGVGETIVRSYAPPEFRQRNQMVLDLTVSSLNLFNELYGAYPYTELDMISTATLALGVEYPGAIVMTMGHYDPAQGFDDPTIISTVVHEVAHQWFYGTVGNDQLDEPWLDESLAQYATWRYWEETQGEQAASGFAAHLDSRWGRVEFADIPIGLPVAAYQEDEYGAIVYGRGALFLGDLERIFGREEFDAFLAHYAARYKYGIATTADFQQASEEACGCDLADEFDGAVHPR